ncbi:chemotaxis protein CheA [Paenibacillus wulumuqiensis]|uniref:chemotaxis protein CheA n=1 Tax=Paenibacillus wulumuqiensis TaxID=1567107 RepID=UPI000AF8DAEF|nr:chemotaxis protein CheA [Paenibacillus wulumuqiensis]
MNRNDLMKFFLEEAEEQLQTLEQEILQMEQHGESDEVIQRIFRAAHTLKGSSAAMGFEPMKTLTHQMENVLDHIRSGQMQVTNPIINILFVCLDRLIQFKAQIELEGTCSGDISDIVHKLQQLIEAEMSAQQTPAEPANLAFLPEEHAALEEAKSNGYKGFILELCFSSTCEMKAARSLIIRSRLEGCTHVIGMKPAFHEIEDEYEGPVIIQYLIACQKPIKEIEATWREITQGESIDTINVLDEFGAPAVPPAISPAESADTFIEPPLSASPDPTSPKAVPVKPEKEDHRRAASSQSVRVDVERLENLMNLVGELVIDQTRIVQVGTVIRDLINADDTMDEFDSITNHISRVVSELQESVMKTRMLPIEQLFNRFPRMVRDLSQSIGKQIHLVIEGKETELDRTVIEEIGDPLIHLIRNSVDHGIEDVEIRKANGKPEAGTIRINAVHQENQVILTIEDDGAGINPQRIKQSAIAKQLITESQAEQMSEQEIIHLIFAPGFSTAKQISDISGRGVGMDIVRSHIEKLNGIIDVDTRLNEGTTFTIKLPLTLAILRGLLIKIHQSIYALPISSVSEIIRLPRQDIHSIKGQMAVKIREQVLPLVWIHDYFHVPRPAARHDDNVFVVIVGVAEKRLALVVDELVGNQEIVVKSMGSYVGKVDGISGATILGDGGVALILDVTGIFNLVGKERSAHTEEMIV